MIDQNPRHRNPIRRRQQRLQLLALPPVFQPGKGDILLERILPRIAQEEVIHGRPALFVDDFVACDVAQFFGVGGRGFPVEPEDVGEFVEGGQLLVAVCVGDAEVAFGDDVGGAEGVEGDDEVLVGDVEAVGEGFGGVLVVVVSMWRDDVYKWRDLR